MGINSTEVSYQFGQLGSVFTKASSSAIVPPTGKVFVAITMLDNTKFDSTGGLVAESFTARIAGGGTSIGDTERNFITTAGAAHDQTAGNANAEKGAGGLQVDNTLEFPKGVTIYGRWEEIDVDTGNGIIAYIGD